VATLLVTVLFGPLSPALEGGAPAFATLGAGAASTGVGGNGARSGAARVTSPPLAVGRCAGRSVDLPTAAAAAALSRDATSLGDDVALSRG
jgi:hypothetical protein